MFHVPEVWLVKIGSTINRPKHSRRADVKLRHAKGKIAENTVYACALLSPYADTQRCQGKKGMISRMSDQGQANHDM